MSREIAAIIRRLAARITREERGGALVFPRFRDDTRWLSTRVATPMLNVGRKPCVNPNAETMFGRGEAVATNREKRIGKNRRISEKRGYVWSSEINQEAQL